MNKDSENGEQYDALKNWIDLHLSEVDREEKEDNLYPKEQTTDLIVSSNVSHVKSKKKSQHFETDKNSKTSENNRLAYPGQVVKSNQNDQTFRRSGIPLSTFLSYDNKHGFFSDHSNLDPFNSDSDTNPRIVSDDENIRELDAGCEHDCDWNEIVSDLACCLDNNENTNCQRPSIIKSIDNSEPNYSKKKCVCMPERPGSNVENVSGFVSDENVFDASVTKESNDKIPSKIRSIDDSRLHSEKKSFCFSKQPGRHVENVSGFVSDEEVFDASVKDESNDKIPSKIRRMEDSRLHYSENNSFFYSKHSDSFISDEEVFDASVKDESKDETSSNNDDNWSVLFSQLCQYYRNHGSCNELSQDPSYDELRRWCTLQRQNYSRRQNSETSLTPIRIKMLKSIGFEFSSLTTGKRCTWREMFTKLKNYKEKYGDCLVPQKFTDDPKLGRWVDKQRHWYKCIKEGRKCSITQNQIDEMDSVGFVWSVNKQHSWVDMFDQLQHYQALHGTCSVSANCEKYSKLGRWVAQQRHHYKRLMTGKASPMRTESERIKNLESIGFEWNLPKKGVTL